MQTFPAFAMNCQTAFWQDNEEWQQDLVLLKNKNKTQPANQPNKKHWKLAHRMEVGEK